MKRVDKKTEWIFAIGELGWALLGGIVTNLLVNFYLPSTTDGGQVIFVTTQTFIGLTVIGLITCVGRVVDAVTDPIIADMSDRCKSKLGKRIPFMRYSALPFAVITVLIFCCPVRGTSAWNIVWLSVTLVIYYVCMTFYCTPYNALIPVLGKEQKDRMDISTYVSLTYIVGTGLAFAGKIVWEALSKATGWDYYVCARIVLSVLALIAFVCMMLPAMKINEKDYDNSEPIQNGNTFKSLGKTFKNKQFRIFVYSDIIYWIGLTIFNTGFIFYVENLLNIKDYYMLLFIFMTAVTFIFYIPTNYLARKYGKKKMMIIGFMIFTVGFLIASFSGIQTLIPNLAYGFIICVFVGIPLAILGVIPQTVIADIAEADCIETKQNHDAMFYAARTFGFKMGQAVAMIIFTSLAVIGQYTDTAGKIQNTGVGYRISLYVAMGLCFIAGLIFFFYNEKKVMGTIDKGHKALEKIEEITEK